MWRWLELGGGRVVESGERIRFDLPMSHAELLGGGLPSKIGYVDAQIDDYAGTPRRAYTWQPRTELTLQARFSQPAGKLVGTAGFGFWNAPFGDPTLKMPALPQAVWFFYGSAPTHLPIAPAGVGNGWFAGTVDAGRWQALSLIPCALPVWLLNQMPAFRQRIMPAIWQRLGVSYQPLPVDLTLWHNYRLCWQTDRCRFWVDGALVHQTLHSPRGPLGFVAWMDNQYMVVRETGRITAGTLPLPQTQWLEIRELEMRSEK